MTSKPRVFIGSSQESERIARAVQSNLQDLEVIVWSQGAFRLSISGLDNLLEALPRFDFGIFVFMPEDVVVQRGKELPAVRDNLLFELGLFLGRLGPRRSFIVAPSSLEDLHLPSDLRGITRAGFNPQAANLDAALAPACDRIRQAIESQVPPARPAAESRFAQQIEDNEGVRTANPMALAIDLLPDSDSIKGYVEGSLKAQGLSMPIEEITMQGIGGRGDIVAFREKLGEARRLLQRRGATEVHLFYAGPAAAAALAGAFFGNWLPFKIYHKGGTGPRGLYEYWAPLEKT
jgi:hypothetical protein